MSAQLAEEAVVPAQGVELFDVVSADGTHIQGWTNNAVGPTVLLCNGLGTNPWCWPALLDPECGVRIVSWFHRGTGGSATPRDRHAAGIDDFVADAVAVMDAQGIESAPVLGWSMGVNTAFELATLHPDRVQALFAVAGTPGGTFRTMLRPLRLPSAVNEALTVNVARVLSLTGRAVTPWLPFVPINRVTIEMLAHSGFMLPLENYASAEKAVAQFLTTPVDWYFHMAVQTSKHQHIDLDAIDVPAMFVAGRWDLLAGAEDMAAAAETMGAEYVEFPASHFVPMERATETHQLLVEFLAELD